MKIINLGIIIYPSTRAFAYLSEFKKLKVYPSEIIILENPNNTPPKLHKESSIYNYTNNFFDLNFDLNDFNQIKVIKKFFLKTSNINSNKVIKYLKKCKNNIFIFTGGGILNKEILSLKKFLHIHPGDVNFFRGSTCNYYSFLNNSNIYCSVFFMNQKIDQGNLIKIYKLNFNFQINENQSLFMDYIFDPYIRALALNKIIKMFMKQKKFIAKKQKITNIRPYYVIHPLLRLITIKKINRFYNSNKKKYIKII